MKSESVDLALASATDAQAATLGLTMCQVARVVRDFLARLERDANWWEGFLLRTVRSYVSQWIDERCQATDPSPRGGRSGTPDRPGSRPAEPHRRRK